MVLSHFVNEKFSGAETQTPPTVINLNFLHSEVVGTLKYYSCTLAALCCHAFMLRGGGNHTYRRSQDFQTGGILIADGHNKHHSCTSLCPCTLMLLHHLLLLYYCTLMIRDGRDCQILDMSQMKQRCTYVHLKNSFLVEVVTLLYKWNEIWNGIYIGLYTNI